MTDKERILMVIVTRIIPGLMYGCFNLEEQKKYIESNFTHSLDLQKGDLVYANTSIYPNDFCVGFVEEVKQDCTVIREIGSSRLCNYYNESFNRINKEYLGYEILEGIQYNIYKKALKAFSKYTSYWTHFRSIEFDGNKCVVTGRNKFENDESGRIEFEYNSKTTMKYIGSLLEKAFKN